MTTTTAPRPAAPLALDLDLDDGVVLRLLAMALDRVQRRRRQPKKPGRLHRV